MDKSTPLIIYEKLASIMADIQAVSKEGKNVVQRYDYRRIDDVINMMHGVFAKHGVAILTDDIEITREEKVSKQGGTLFFSHVRVRYMLCASDGSSVTTYAIGSGMDQSDKATNKAMSAALKYCLGQMFLIPFQMVDSEIDSHEAYPTGSTLIDETELTLTNNHINTIENLLEERGINEERFWNWAKASSRVKYKREIPDRHYNALLLKINELKGEI